MRIRDSQLGALAATTLDRTRKESLLRLKDNGYEVSEDPSTSSFLVRDAGSNTARVESLGLRCRVTSPEGRVTETEQYASGRIRRIVDPSGRSVLFERDADGFLQSIDRGTGGGIYRFKLSEDWKPLRIEYPDGTTSVTEYSAAGGPTRVVQRDGTELRYEYTSDDRLTALVDPKGQRTRLLDRGPGASRLIEYPNGDRHEFIDDIIPQVTRFDVNGETHAWYKSGSDEGSVEAQYKDGSSESFVFKDGRLVEAKNEHSSIKLEYDEAGRLVSEETDGRVLRYLRNEVGALVGLVTPGGDTISYLRDRDQRLTGITDWRGDRYKISLPPSGPPAEIRYPNGVTVNTSTNEMGLPARWAVLHSGPSQVQLDATAWQHDECDRLVTATRDGKERSYRYNRASRLTEVLCSDPTLQEAFDLDSCGNRVQSDGAPCSYDALNRLLRHGNGEYVYDGLGNQTEVRDGKDSRRYRFNGRGQLVEITMPGIVASYKYDPLGRRISKQVNGIVTHFEWAGTQLLSETVEDGKAVVRRDYLVCPEFLTPLAFREGTSVYYVHAGRLQEPLSVTDKNAQIVWKSEYLAFGRVLVSVGRVRQPLRLPGQYFDQESGLHYAIARYYDPNFGRFLSMDPRRQPGASLNYYAYCDGDPVNRIDPIGEIGLTLGTVLTAMAVGAVVGAAIGAGVELYRQRNQDQIDWAQVGTAALIGGCLGAIGGAVFTVAAAATVGTLGVIGAGAAAGGLSGAVTYCVQAAGQGHWNWTDFGTSVVAGALIGAVTMGIGAVFRSQGVPRGGIGPVLKGQAGVDRAIAQIESEGGTVLGREVTVEAGGVRTRPDLLVQNADGSIEFVEVKNGPNAGLTPNQETAFPAIRAGGAVPRGANAQAAGLPVGAPLPPTPVRVIQYP